jgi:hypothetical protein
VRISLKVSLEAFKLFKNVRWQSSKWPISQTFTVPLSCELALLEGGHEVGRQAERSQRQVALGTLASIVYERHDSTVILLVVNQVLDEVEVDEAAHHGTGVEADIVGINVHLLQVLDHLVLVCDVGLLPRGSGGDGGSIVLVRIGGGGLGRREAKGVGDLEGVVDVHADEGTSRRRGEGCGAVLGDLHDHLQQSKSASLPHIMLHHISTQRPAAWWSRAHDEGGRGGVVVMHGGAPHFARAFCLAKSTHQSIDKHRLERLLLLRVVRHIEYPLCRFLGNAITAREARRCWRDGRY